MITWQLFPRSARPCQALLATIRIFESNVAHIDSTTQTLESNDVLKIVANDLKAAGFAVEEGKSKESKIAVPVLFGLNGAIEKSFFADAFHPEDGVVLEVEAGRAVDNNQFLKDLFQACGVVPFFGTLSGCFLHLMFFEFIFVSLRGFVS